MSYKKIETFRENDIKEFSDLMFQVNIEGQLFRLSEWSASIASQGENTYILFMDDYQMDQNHLELD